MVKRARVAGIAAILALGFTMGAWGQSGTIEGVEVLGLVRMTTEAFHHAFGIRAGDPYDVNRIRAQYRHLWSLGLFDDIKILAEDGANGGKVLVVRVKERRTLNAVTYEDNKVLTRTTIEDRFKEKKISLDIGKPINLRSIFDAENTIRDLLGEKGYLDAVVRHKVDEPTTASVAVTFQIRPGAKTRIRKIVFVGNKVYKSKTLMKQLKLTRAWQWYWPLSSKSLYHPAKWDQDSGGIRDLYQNNGYLDVDIRPPVVELREVRRKQKPDKAKPAAAGEGEKTPPTESAQENQAPSKAGKPESEAAIRRRLEKERLRQERAKTKADKAARRAEDTVKRRWAYLTVRIDEGPQDHTGEVTPSGNTVFSDKVILSSMRLNKGSVLNSGLLDNAVKAIQRGYQDRGYAYATARREIQRHENEPVADVRIVVNEDKPYYISRIEFAGNTQTQDRVLRREFGLHEGDLYSASLLDLSVRKVNQLGYFEAKREDVVVEPIEGEGRVKITVPGEEKGRNEIQVGGGYSGLEGAFFQGLYSTRNFLGRGQILSASLQVGGRQNLYQLSFVEPWFLGKPYTFGVNLYKRITDYGSNLRSSGQGGGVVFGRQLGWFDSFQVRYDFQRASSQGFSLTGTTATYQISSVSPSYVHNTINDPYRPTRGFSVGADSEIAGGPLGGDTYFLRPRVNYTGYIPALRKSFIALHAEGGLIRSWRGGSTESSANVEGIPRLQRFFLGGEIFGPRIFETRSVSPLRYVRIDTLGRILETTTDPRGRPASDFDRNGDGLVDRRDLVEMGGDRYWLVQAEYVFAFNSPVELAFFVDAADSLFEDQSWGFHDMRASAGVELRFYLPVFPVPLRLIYGVPLRKLPEDRTTGFTFSIGRSF